MLVSKSFVVVGGTSIMNGVHVKDIAEKVDAAVNEYLSNMDGKYVDIKPNVQIHPGVGQDYAFITLIIETDEPMVEEPENMNGSAIPVKRKPGRPQGS